MTLILQELCHQIEIPLYNILELNEKDLTVRVEPMVTVGEITKFLIPKGILILCQRVVRTPDSLSAKAIYV